MSSGSYIKLTASGGISVPAFLSKARNPGKAAIVLAQEIFGVNRYIRQLCADWGATGFTTLAPELYWRFGKHIELDPIDSQEVVKAREYRSQLKLEESLADIETAIAQLRRNYDQVFLVGYCFGGLLAYLSSIHCCVDGAISYYGVRIEDYLDRADNIHSPLLVHIGAEDPVCPPQAQAEICKVLAGNPLVKLITHIGAGHAFARRGTPSYNEEAARTANLQSLEFMQRLGAGKKNKRDKS